MVVNKSVSLLLDLLERARPVTIDRTSLRKRAFSKRAIKRLLFICL
jgi:hypothetical protein